LSIGPADELLLTNEDLQAGVDRIQNSFDTTIQKLTAPERRDELAEAFAYDLEKLQAGERIDDIYKYASYFYNQSYSLIDYLPQDGIILVDELLRVEEMGKHLDKEEKEWQESLKEMNRLLHDMNFSRSWEDVYARWV